MLRPDTRIIEPCRYRVGFLNLPVTVIQKLGKTAVQYAWLTGRQSRRIIAEARPVTTGFHAQ